MNFKSEDFPTPVSPMRRIVYGAFALFFAVLTIPRLRKFTALRRMVQKYGQNQYVNDVPEIT